MTSPGLLFVQMHLHRVSLLLGLCFALTHAVDLHHQMTADELARLLGSKSPDQIPEYDLVTPVQVDQNGDFRSHDLSTVHLRTRRSDYHLVKDVPAYFRVPAFGDEHHLAVSPNNALLSPGFLVQIYLDDGKTKTDFEYSHSQYVGMVKGDDDSHVAISNYGGKLMGVIITANTTLMLQPLPDHHSSGNLANPKNHTHIIYRRQADAELPTSPYGRARECYVNETTITPEEYKEARRFRDGIIRGEDLPEGSSLSQEFIVEAMVVADWVLYRKWNYNADHTKYYIITLMNIASSMYNSNKLGFNIRLILTRVAIFTSENAQRQQQLYVSQNSKTTLENFCEWQAENKPAANSPLSYDHAFLFTGYGMCFGRNEDCWELGRAWVQGMCRDKYACSVNADKGMQLGFVFAHELGHNLGMSHDGANGRCSAADGYVMKSSTAQAQRIYLWSSCSKNYLLNYLARGETSCLLDKPAHFFPSFGRDNYRLPGAIYSADQQCKFSFGSQATFCRKEPPELDYQINDVCNNLYCDDKDWPRCVTTYTGAADGTPCGDFSGRRVCYRRQCVDRSEAPVPQLPYRAMYRVNFLDPDGNGVAPKPQPDPRKPNPQPTPRETRPTAPPGPPPCIPSGRPVHGQWSEWSAPSACSRTCGGGFQRRDRSCNNPTPANCGRKCAGDSTRYNLCNVKPCAKEDFRLEQCQAYMTEVNKVKKGVDLVPDYNVPKADRCNLKCISSTSVKYTLKAPEAADGTLCDNDSSSNDRCLLGKCVSVGCDNVIGSGKKFDYCGVCGGNGARCKKRSDSYNLVHDWHGYFTVTIFPAKASQILVEGNEKMKFALFDTDGNLLIRFDESRSFTYDNTVFLYTASPQSLRVTGQLSKPVILKIYYLSLGKEKPNVKYSYSLPPSETIKDSDYAWLLKTSPCSVTCGSESGEETSVYKCVRKSTGASTVNKNCNGVSRPPKRRRTCKAPANVSCPKPPSNPDYEWKTGSFGECNKKCVRKRPVTCINTKTKTAVDVSKCDAKTMPKAEGSCARCEPDKHSAICNLLVTKGCSTCRKKVVREFCPYSCRSA